MTVKIPAGELRFFLTFLRTFGYAAGFQVLLVALGQRRPLRVHVAVQGVSVTCTWKEKVGQLVGFIETGV